MDQRELTKKDASGKDIFVIALVLHLSNPDDLIQEMRIFKKIVFEWHRVRLTAAAEVRFFALSDPKYHQAIEEFLELCHSNDVDLKPIFKSTNLSLSLHTPDATLVRERIFEKKKDAWGILERWFSRATQPR